MNFNGEETGACLQCGTYRVLDSETMLCKDCWREHTEQMQRDLNEG